MDTIRPEFDRPAPFQINTREWIVCDEEDMEGFAILVRTSITNAEHADLAARHAVIVRDADAWAALSEEEQAATPAADLPRSREWNLIAPYVLDWNAAELVDGEVAVIPPPAQAGPQAFAQVTTQCSTWILRVLLYGYLITGKARRWLGASGRPGATSAPAEEWEQEEADPNLPQS